MKNAIKILKDKAYGWSIALLCRNLDYLGDHPDRLFYLPGGRYVVCYLTPPPMWGILRDVPQVSGVDDTHHNTPLLGRDSSRSSSRLHTPGLHASSSVHPAALANVVGLKLLFALAIYS